MEFYNLFGVFFRCIGFYNVFGGDVIFDGIVYNEGLVKIEIVTYDLDFFLIRFVISDYWNGEMKDVVFIFFIINDIVSYYVGKMEDDIS